uniref:Homeodomain phBC6A51-type domain-containing protein n=1 Tax=viral metagenome TaxID=1070528 RepID=A0A6M3KLK9_9ZZZZ
MNATLSAEHLKAVELLANHAYKGNLTKIAAAVGVTTKTLWEWRKRDEFKTALYARARELMADDIPPAAKELRKAARRGEPWAIDRLFKITGFFDNDQMNINLQNPLTLLIELAEKRKNGAGSETE